MLLGIYIDTNLLVLLVVGLTGPTLISKHRRTQEFTVDDYDLLVAVVDRSGKVFVTPNTLTEACNLLAQHAEPERSQLLSKLKNLVEESSETVISSEDAANHGEFLRLGLTDAVLLEAVSPETPLVTVDLKLYAAALAGGKEAAINFNHSRFAEV